jgi:hypothetical protein
MGTEVKEVGLKCRPGTCEGHGERGRKLPPSLNLWEVVMRRMTTRKRQR